ncbi:MAG: AraC family ligand binding domain-containing protein, partial [Clostridia bacterium]
MLPYVEGRSASITVLHFIDMTFPMHLHTHVEMIYLLRGEMRLQTDGGEILLSAGDTGLFFPHVIHGYQTENGSEGILLIFHPSIVGTLQNELMKSYPVSPRIAKDAVHPDIHYLMHQLDPAQCGALDDAVLRAYLQLLLARAMPLLTLSPVQEKQGTALLLRAIQYISMNYQEELTLPNTACALNVSPYHLSHTLHAHLHTSFRAYLNA